MRVPLDEANSALGLGHGHAPRDSGGVSGGTAPLLAALHPNRRLLALARGPVLSVLPVQHDDADQQQLPRRSPRLSKAPAPSPAAAGPAGAPPLGAAPHAGATGTAPPPAAAAAAARGPPGALFTLRSSQDVTALAWLCVLTSARQLGAAAATVRPPAAGELLEVDVLLVGLCDGTLELHEPAGRALFRQRLHAGPVEHICVRPHTAGLRADDPTEDVTITFPDALVRLPVLELRTHLKLLQLSQQSTSGAGVSPLHYQRWELPAGVGPRSSGVCLGVRPRDLDCVLAGTGRGGGGSGGGRAGEHKLLIVTAGQKPPVAGVEVEERPQRGTLAYLASVAGSVTSAAYGAASRAATLGPSLLGHGARALAGWVAGGGGAAGGGGGAPAYDLALAPKPEASSLWRPLKDDARALGALAPAPAGPLLAAPDNLGRVLLVDGATLALVRMWKGYRNAQCGWAHAPPGHPWLRHGLLLVLYAPRRELLEVWAPRSAARVAHSRVDGPARLLPLAPPCGGWRNELAGRWAAAVAPGGGGPAGAVATTLLLRLGGRERGTLLDVLDLAHAC